MMFSMEELVGVVKLIIQMESAVAQDDDRKEQNFDNARRQNRNRHRNGKNGKHHHHKKDREPPNIQRWISKRSKRDILFLLASISGVKMKIYSLPSSTKLNGRVLTTKPNKFNVCKERVCRVSMDGKYLSMGEDCINLDKRLEISLGVDMCYNNVRVILKQLGLYNYYTNSTFSSDSGSSSFNNNHNSRHNHNHHDNDSSSTSSTIPTDEYIKNARFNHRLNGNNVKLKPKHCITIHDPATARTLILQLTNCSDRTMWAKGLCHLKHLNQKARNFRWTVVAYLISKYANTLNAHSQNNLNHKSNGLKGVTKGLNALKMGLTGGSSSKYKSSSSSSNNTNHRSTNPMNTPCYFEPFVQLIKVIGSQTNGGLQHKYPPRYKEMYKRRQNRLKNNKSNYEQFGENELMYDPNKVQPKPEDNDIFYE